MLEFLINGGAMMIPLLACSIAALAVLIDRIVAFTRYSKIDNRALRANLLSLLREERLTDAKTLCNSTPGPVSAVLMAGLLAYEKFKSVGGSSDSLRSIMGKAMSDFSLHAVSGVESRFNILSTVATAAPLFGMTGTVTGMINSFSAMATAGAMNAGVVGAGIAEALITTAAGLIIALFAAIPYNVFMGMTEKISLEIEEASAEMVDFLTLRVESPGQA